MFKKIMINSFTSLVITTPIIGTISCETKVKKLIIREDRMYFLDVTIQSSPSRKVFTMSEYIRKSDLSKLPSDFNAAYKAKMLVGGFGEPRSFYSGDIKTKKPASFYHLGYDIIVPQKTKIYAPQNGEIIAAWSKAPSEVEIASGVGGEILMRIKIEDLNVDQSLKEMIYIKKLNTRRTRTDYVAKVPKLLFAKKGKYQGINSKTNMELATKKDYDDFLETRKGMPYKQIAKLASSYIYIFFMHLSKETINHLDNNTKETNYNHYITKEKRNVIYKLRMAPNIDIDKPLKVRKGEHIAYVGDSTDNGGWPHHVHIESYIFAPYRSNKIARAYGKNSIGGYRIKETPVTSEMFKKIYTSARAVGTYSKSGVDRYDGSFSDWYINRYQAIDVNEIFDLYDEKTPIEKIII